LHVSQRQNGAAIDHQQCCGVLNGLREKLVAPHLVEEFIREFHAEVKLLKQRTVSEMQAQKRSLAKVQKQIGAIIEAIKDGTRTPGMEEELEALEAQRTGLVGRLSLPNDQDNANVIEFHPGLPALYRQKVGQLQTALQDEALRREAMAILRTLIEKVIVTPTEAGIDVALYGELGALMALAETRNDGRPGSLKPGRSLSVVAGKRNQRYLHALRAQIPLVAALSRR
jgi:site-specific DNA recombinase